MNQSLWIPPDMQERRSGKDRRAVSTRALSFYSVMGRRHVTGRRSSDRPGYVDLYHPALFFILILILFLSTADAYLTLEALGAGCREVNPAMNAALAMGDAYFVAIKTLATGLGLTLLCMHKNYPRVRGIILLVLAGYLSLIGYHFWLMQFR